MNVETFIQQYEKTSGRSPIVQEMWHIYENPEVLEDDNPMPNYTNMSEHEAVPLHAFYTGLLFGIGMSHREDIDVSVL